MAQPAPRDAAAFCAAEYGRLVGALALYVGEVAVAEELAQEALLRAFQRWDHVRELESPGGWVHRVALNLANSHFRRRRTERAARSRLPRGAEAAESDVAGAVSVRRAIASLPERQREAVVLRYWLDWPTADIASHLATTPAGTRALLKRAVAGLRERLGDDLVAEDAEEVSTDAHGPA